MVTPHWKRVMVFIDGTNLLIELAKEIVYYADKRVKHDEIVDLDMRLEYILDRYGLGDPRRHRAIENNFRQSKLMCDQ